MHQLQPHKKKHATPTATITSNATLSPTNATPAIDTALVMTDIDVVQVMRRTLLIDLYECSELLGKCARKVNEIPDALVLQLKALKISLLNLVGESKGKLVTRN